MNKKKPTNIQLILESLLLSIKMLSPVEQLKKPLLFVTYLGTLVVTIYVAAESIMWKDTSFFHLQITLWLWLMIVSANFADAFARKLSERQAVFPKIQEEVSITVIKDGKEKISSIADLKMGDIVLCCAGDVIPTDGEVIDGVATVDESPITGESAPIIRESGGDRSAVTAGTIVVSDFIKIRVTALPGNSIVDHMVALIEQKKLQKTPNEEALYFILHSLTVLFIVVISTLWLFIDFSSSLGPSKYNPILTLPVFIAIILCFIPGPLDALTYAINIQGLNRLLEKKVIAKRSSDVEAAGDIDLLLLDKTGTITMGNRMATTFIPNLGVEERELAKIAQLASIADETPEGRSIVVLAKSRFELKAEDLDLENSQPIPFTANSRMSGIDFFDKNGNIIRQIRKGASDVINTYLKGMGIIPLPQVEGWVQTIALQGATPLLVTDNKKIMGVIELKDLIKGGLKERFEIMRRRGLRTILISGDLTATTAAIAAEIGVDDYIAEATPSIKLDIIKKEQQNGWIVGMIGDGTNDAPALAQADVGVSMNTGTLASREAGNMIDLDNNPTKLIDIVEIGKQLIVTRGALSIFYIANTFGKYIAILPAVFFGLYITEKSPDGILKSINFMHLNSPKSAILGVVIFNVLMVIALVPFALKGLKYYAGSVSTIVKTNFLIFGVGGIMTPFFVIKCIDIIINYFGIQ